MRARGHTMGCQARLDEDEEHKAAAPSMQAPSRAAVNMPPEELRAYRTQAQRTTRDSEVVHTAARPHVAKTCMTYRKVPMFTI